MTDGIRLDAAHQSERPSKKAAAPIFARLRWVRKLELDNADQKLVLFLLVSYADAKGTCFPSQERLAIDAHLSRGTVLKALKSLEEKGIVARTRRYDAGLRTSDLILVKFGTLAT